MTFKEITEKEVGIWRRSAVGEENEKVVQTVGTAQIRVSQTWYFLHLGPNNYVLWGCPVICSMFSSITVLGQERGLRYLV